MDRKDQEFIEEVQEDIQHENLMRMWNRYGRYVIILVGSILAAAVLFVLWQNMQERNHAKHSDQYFAAIKLLRDGNKDGGMKELDALSQNSDGYGKLAAFIKAGIQSGTVRLSKDDTSMINTNEAKKSFETLAKNTSGFYSELASLGLELLTIDEKEATKATAELSEKMKPGKGWRFTAAELLALIQAKAGQEKEAHDLLVTLAKDPHAPQSIRMRAAHLTGVDLNAPEAPTPPANTEQKAQEKKNDDKKSDDKKVDDKKADDKKSDDKKSEEKK